MAPSPTLYGLPERPRETPIFGIERRFPWDHALPGPTDGGIFYIPSLDLMCTQSNFGSIELRDPVTTKVKLSFIYIYGNEGIVGGCYVPSCEKLVLPLYAAGGTNQIVIMSLTERRRSVIDSISFGTYQAAYCPVNDLVFVAAYSSSVVYVVDPWKETLHTTTQITGSPSQPARITFCPLNRKLYTASINSNNLYQIEPTTFAIDATIAMGAVYDVVTYSDAMQKLVLTNLNSGGQWKSVDPLNANAIASIGPAVGGASAMSCPLTGETLVVSSTTETLYFLDQSGAQITTVVLTGTGVRYCGWNPVTEKFWLQGGSGKFFGILDPIERTVTRLTTSRLVS